MLLRAHILHLLLLSILLVGCGGSFLDDPVGQLGTDTSSRVTHQNWGSYRLYRFEAGTWHRIVDLGQPTEPLPLLNERPVLIVHGLGANFETGLLDPLAASLLSMEPPAFSVLSTTVWTPSRSTEPISAKPCNTSPARKETEVFGSWLTVWGRW